MVQRQNLDVVEFSQHRRDRPLELVVPQRDGDDVRQQAKTRWQGPLELVRVEIEGFCKKFIYSQNTQRRRERINKTNKMNAQ